MIFEIIFFIVLITIFLKSQKNEKNEKSQKNDFLVICSFFLKKGALFLYNKKYFLI